MPFMTPIPPGNPHDGIQIAMAGFRTMFSGSNVA
jgi:hypothetical protein